MNEKVKLTKEQAEAIEYLKKLLSDTSERKRNLQLIKEKLDHDYHWESPNFKAANEIPDDIFIAALHYGYEVEPEFKVGDWVVDTLNNYTFRIHAVVNYRVVPDWFEGIYDKGNTDESDWIPIGYLRHATPEEIEKEKERRWWAKHGREVWELKPNDLLVNKYTRVVQEVREVDGNGVHLSGREYSNVNILKLDFKVACFAEDRKDIWCREELESNNNNKRWLKCLNSM